MPIETISDIIYGPQSNIPNRQSTCQQKSANDLFHKEFPLHNDTGARNNKAVKALVNLVMAGTYINTNISYPILTRPNGSLPEAENAQASLKNEGTILFTWTDNSGAGTANTNDKVILITYFPALRKMIYTLHAATRGNGSALLAMDSMKGCSAETWIGFVSHDEKEAGNSVYAGQVVL
jgi:hypothetical protein